MNDLVSKKVTWLPKTILGKSAVILIAAFFALFALKAIPLPLPSQLIFAVGFAGFITSIIAFFKKDRSIIGYIPLVLGLLITVFIIAELLHPH